MSIGAVSSDAAAVALHSYDTSPTAPYQSSPTDSTTVTNLPLTQTVAGATDNTFTASTVDHELNAVTTPNPFGTIGNSAGGGNPQPDSLAQAGIGLHISAAQ